MPVQVTIIGLGQIGASIGMALAAHKDNIVRVGHDKNTEVAREAQKKGAVDKIVHNLPASVDGAKIVVLALPLSQIEETFRYISQDLPYGALVLDTAPVKAEVAKWARKHLPSGRNYVGLVPALNPELLEKIGSGLAAAQADLFSHGMFFVDAPPGTPGDAIGLASEFVYLLGATPLLTDMVESDGLTASTHILPQLLAVSLVNATVDQPGWFEARKIAGRPFAVETSATSYQDEPDSLSMAVMQNREAIVHKLNALLVELYDLREDIESGNESNIKDRMRKARAKREHWFEERLIAEWTRIRSEPIEVQSISERWLGTFFSKSKKKE